MRRTVRTLKTGLAVFCVAGYAHATPVAVWSGPGPSACNLPGANCSQDWAKSTLTDLQRAELEAVLADNPEPYPLTIPSGSVVAAMAYYREGAIMDRRGTVLLVDAPAMGWHVGDWTFARIDACGNWSVSRRGQMIGSAETPGAIETVARGSSAPLRTVTPIGFFPGRSPLGTSNSPGISTGVSPGKNIPGTTPDAPLAKPKPPLVTSGFEPEEGSSVVPPKTQNPTPVPVPMTGLLLLSAAAILWVFKRPKPKRHVTL